MKYAIIAVSILTVFPAWAGGLFDTDQYNEPPSYNSSYQAPSYGNAYQQEEAPRYDNEYYRSRGAVGPSIGDRFGNHLDSGWGGR